MSGCINIFADVLILWDKIRAHRVEVLPLDKEGLRQAIVRPAEGVDVYVDSALVERLLVDATGEPGVLPLIQETLVLLWEKLERHFLPIKAYELLILPRPAYGETLTQPQTRLQVAIALRADAALAGLETSEEQAIAQRIFLRLVQFGEGRADTRRQQSIEALQAIGDDPVLFQNTLNRLVNSRLLTLSGKEGATKSSNVDLAHEALISGWSTLQEWIKLRRKAEQVRRRLEAQAQEWVRLGQESGGLLDAIELAEAERWLKSSDAQELGYSPSSIALITHSQQAIQAAIQEKLDREQKSRKAEQVRNRVIIGSLISVLIVVSTAGGFAWYQRQQAIDMIINGSLETRLNTPDMLSLLNEILERAKSQQVEDAIKYYRAVAIKTERLKNKELEVTQKKIVDTLSKNAEKSLIDLIQLHRIPKLKTQLAPVSRMIGKYINGKRHSELQNQFTEGALQTSYQILIVDTGASLDTGLLDNQAQAKMIPCEILQEIEKKWRESSNKKCGFYGIDKNGINSVYVGSPGCVFGEEIDLSSTTLTKILVGYSSGTFLQERLEYCHVMPRKNL
jgi:hypothetical protein